MWGDSERERESETERWNIALTSVLQVDFNLTDPQRVAVETMQAGDVFVIDARGETRCGTMGAILASRMDVRGVAGLVRPPVPRPSHAVVPPHSHLLCQRCKDP